MWVGDLQRPSQRCDRTHAADAQQSQPAPAASVTQLPPMTDAARIASARPYADAIQRRLRELAGQGDTDPAGNRVFPAAPDDAKAWDGIGARMDIDDRVWFIADLQRRAGGRDGGALSAPVPDEV